MVQPNSVAVVDIGSNSIKLLVAHRGDDGSIASLAARTIDARISAGISRDAPRLSEEGIARGIDAVRALLADANAFSPVETVLVATSAVRDARNGAEFRERVRLATGCTVRILTGEEEANFIGRGLTCDPALRDLRDFYVLDLGGGSLECLAFRDRRIEQAISLPLGCVRLTEKFVADSNAPFPATAAAAITTHTADVIRASSFDFRLAPEAVAVATGGTMITARAMLGLRAGRSFADTDASVPLASLKELQAWLAPLPLAKRKTIPGLPPARADVMPAAVTVFIALADLGGFSAFRNSVYNLRFGLADELLGSV